MKLIAKLLKEYGFNSDMQYYEMCIESYANGQKNQARAQFNAMKKEDKQIMFRALINDTWSQPRDVTIFFFNLF